MQLIDRTRSLGHQVGQWMNDAQAAEFLAEIAKRGESVYEVILPSNVQARLLLPNGEEVIADMARIIIKPDGSIRTAFPIRSLYE